MVNAHAWRLSGHHIQQILARGGDQGVKVLISVDTETNIFWSPSLTKPPAHPTPDPLPPSVETETIPNGGSIVLMAKVIWVERVNSTAPEISGTLQI